MIAPLAQLGGPDLPALVRAADADARLAVAGVLLEGSLAADRRRLLDRLLDDVDADDLQRLRGRLFTPSAIRRRRDRDRDRLYRALAVAHVSRLQATGGGVPAGLKLAEAVATEVERYAMTAWRHERDRLPADPRRATLHRLLTLTAGLVLSASRLRSVLAGLPGLNRRQARKRSKDRANLSEMRKANP